MIKRSLKLLSIQRPKRAKLRIHKGSDTKHMNYNKLVVLATAGLILAVTGVGNAFAYTWGGTDDSTLGTSWPYWNSGASGYPNVVINTGMTWDNKFKNDRTYDVYPKLVATDQNDQNPWTWNGGSLRPGNTVQVTGQYTAAGTTGWHCIYSKHWYGSSQGGTQYSYANPFHQHDYNAV